MQKRLMVLLMLVFLAISSLMFTGAKCKPDESGVVVVEEEEGGAQQQDESTSHTFTKESLEGAGVPVYPSTDDQLTQEVKVSKDGKYGEYFGSVTLHSSTCPPENVARFYDAMLSRMPGYQKNEAPDSIIYKFTAPNGDDVEILIMSDGGTPMEGSKIRIFFNQ